MDCTKLKIFILISILSIFNINADENREINTIESFQIWVENNILCKDFPQDITITDDYFIKQMQQFKFDIALDIDDESGVYDGEVKTNNIPIIFDLKLQKISFYKDSGIGFYAFVVATPERLKGIVKDNKLDQYSITSDNKEIIYTFLTSKPIKENPYGIESKGIVISNTDQPNISRIGCQQFDYYSFSFD